MLFTFLEESKQTENIEANKVMESKTEDPFTFLDEAE